MNISQCDVLPNTFSPEQYMFVRSSTHIHVSQFVFEYLSAIINLL